MKNKLIIIFSTSLILTLYLLLNIGFGLHTCTCSGETDVHLLLGNIELSHSQCCECSHHHHECAHDHQEGCCKTVILILSEDQDSHTHFDVSFDEVSNFYSELFFEENDFYFLTSEFLKIFLIKESPPLLLNNSRLSMFSQYRV